MDASQDRFLRAVDRGRVFRLVAAQLKGWSAFLTNIAQPQPEAYYNGRQDYGLALRDRPAFAPRQRSRDGGLRRNQSPAALRADPLGGSVSGAAIVRCFPSAERGWPATQRIRWFRTFAMNVSQIYDGDAMEPVEMKIDLEGAAN
jgi:hypothetical protein